MRPARLFSDDRGFRRDVLAALRELKPSIVRWPGGCFASGYRLTNGVGKWRHSVPDPVWGGQDPNTFGTGEFVEWCRRVGCEPYICSNAGDGMADEMSAWVEHCTDGRPVAGCAGRMGLASWPFDIGSIGNERGGHEIGARTPQEWGPASSSDRPS
ncbi:MAG: hypothetical protein U1G07_27480 [Verrucomicrobiota bacterium]